MNFGKCKDSLERVLIKDNRKLKKNLFSLNIRRLYMRLFALSPTIRRLFADYSPTIRRLFADYSPTIRRLFADYSTTIRRLFDDYSTTIRRLFSFYQLPRERVSLSFFLCKVLHQLITMSNTLDGNPSHCSVLLAFQRHLLTYNNIH